MKRAALQSSTSDFSQARPRILAIAIIHAVLLLGCGRVEDRTNMEARRSWFSYIRLTEGSETQLSVDEAWEYNLVQSAPGSRRGGVLNDQERKALEELFSNGLENYESDSRNSSGADMGECDAISDHPVVHRILIAYDPPVGAEGFGCWSPVDELTDDTRMMIERMEELLETLVAEESGM